MIAKNVFLLSFFVVLVSNISFFALSNPEYVGWAFNGTCILSLFLLVPRTYRYASTSERLYIGTMLAGLCFHLFISGLKNPVNDAMRWIFIIIILFAGRKFAHSKKLFYAVIIFFIAHCTIAIMEQRTQAHIIDYRYVEKFVEMYDDNSQFRAFGLMEHPLYSANIALIIMSFLLINNNIGNYLKYGLLALGTLALVCFNSRAAMIIWAGIILYRMFLYNRNPLIGIATGLVVYMLFINDFFSLVLQQNAAIFGRLAEKNSLTDGSSASRVSSWLVFFNQPWTFENTLLGGRILYIPGTEASLENGLLLTIAWWGWLVGLAKVILEILISWFCMKGYDTRDKVIVMIATWVCANTNNNTVNTFVLAFFVISFLAFNSIENKSPYSYELRHQFNTYRS